jgi:transposase
MRAGSRRRRPHNEPPHPYLSGALRVGKSADIDTITLALDTLPDDAESLKALIARLAADREDLAGQCGQLKHEQAAWRQEKAALAVEMERLEANNARLDHIVMVLRRGRFGRSSERLSEEQINLALEDVETAIAAENAKAEKQSEAAKRHGAKQRRANRGHALIFALRNRVLTGK